MGGLLGSSHGCDHERGIYIGVSALLSELSTVIADAMIASRISLYQWSNVCL